MKAKYPLIGIGASALLFSFYFIVSSLLAGPGFAVRNFLDLWPWMAPLIAGFGVQAALFFYLRDEMKKSPVLGSAASTGVSSASMVACCAHHLADIAPFLGISALGLFLSEYQVSFLLAGIFSNILGIAYMAGLAMPEKRLSKPAFYSLAAIAVVIVAFSFLSTSQSKEEPSKTVFPPLTSYQDEVEFLVTPLSASEFDISINTHTVSLDFRVEEISMLYDDLNKSYAPLSWEGSPPGGHHRTGTLRFPEMGKKAKAIRLVIDDGYKREFEWRLDGKEAD